MASPQALIESNSKESSIQFKLKPYPADQVISGLPDVSRVITEGEDTVVYTGNVPSTISALMALATQNSLELSDLFGPSGFTGRCLFEVDRQKDTRLRSFVAVFDARFRQFTRNRGALFFSFFFPIIFILLFGWAFQNMGTQTFDIGVADQGSPDHFLHNPGLIKCGAIQQPKGIPNSERQS